MFVPSFPQTLMLKTYPPVWCYEDRRPLGSDGALSWSSQDGIKKRCSYSLPFACRIQETGCLQPGSRFTEHRICQHHDLGLHSLQNYEKWPFIVQPSCSVVFYYSHLTWLMRTVYCIQGNWSFRVWGGSPNNKENNFRDFITFSILSDHC